MDPAQTLTFRLHALVYSMDKLGKKILKDYTEVNLSQFLMILCVCQCPGCTQKDAADWLQITQASISYMTKKQEIQEYIEIIPDTIDARVKRLHPTKKGKMLVNNIFPILEKALRPHFDVISKEEQERMKRHVDAIHESIDQTFIETSKKGSSSDE